MSPFTDDERRMIEVWEAHTAAEFEQKDADAAVATMTDHPVLNHVPVGTGATGRDAVRRFYGEIFIPQTPDDLDLENLTRSVGQNRLIDASLPVMNAGQCDRMLNVDAPANERIDRFGT